MSDPWRGSFLGGSARGAVPSMILNENFARMRNEELGMKVAASPLDRNSLPLEGKVPRRGG